MQSYSFHLSRVRELKNKKPSGYLLQSLIRSLEHMHRQNLVMVSIALFFTPLSSAEASFALGHVGSLEAEERVRESTRGAHLLFSPIHLPHPLGASAEERVLYPTSKTLPSPPHRPGHKAVQLIPSLPFKNMHLWSTRCIVQNTFTLM